MTTEIQRDEMQRAATSAASSYGGDLPSRDPTPDLRPSSLRGIGGGPGQFDRMRRGHPGVATGCRELALAIGSATVEMVPCADDETESEAAFREDLEAMLVRSPYVDAINGDGGWAALGVTLAEYFFAGHYLAEIRFVRSPRRERRRIAALDGLTLELYPIHASSVQAWNVSGEHDQRLESVTQSTPVRFVDIMADRLIYMRHGGAPGEWEGVSILRPLVFAVERWISIATSAERNSYFGGGVAKVRSPKAEDPAGRALILQSVKAWQNGAAAYLVTPPGWDIDISYPSSAASDPRGVLEYYDGLIAQSVGRALSALGYSARGSLALGEAVAAADGWQTTAQLDLLLGMFGERVGHWVAREIGYVGRMPRLRAVGESSPDVAARVATVSQAVTSGLVSWQADDEARIRDELDLAATEAKEEGRALLVGQIQAVQAIVAQLAPADPLAVPLAPAAARELLTAAGVPAEAADRIIDAQIGASAPTPAPVAVDAAESYRPPQGVADEAARALAWRRKHGRGGTEVGVARARDLSNRRPVSLDTLKRMRAYFDRHEADKDGEGYRPGSPGYPSAGRIAWGLWGGDAGRRWAVDRLSGIEATECAACSSVDLAEAPGVDVVDCDGQTFRASRPLEGVELSVSWSSNQRQLDELTDAAERRIAAIAREHRRAIWAALADGRWSSREQAEIYDRFVAEYQAAVDAYAVQVGTTVDRWAAEEQARQVRAGVPSTIAGASSRELPDRDRVLDRIGPRIQVASEQIANRVQGEVESAWSGGADATGWRTRITDRGLVRPVRSLGSAIESEGRVAAASSLATGDLVVVEVVRTTVNDLRRCEHCRERDGYTGTPSLAQRFKIPEQIEQYRAQPLPDPECAGSDKNCRCGWLVIWGRR